MFGGAPPHKICIEHTDRRQDNVIIAWLCAGWNVNSITRHHSIVITYTSRLCCHLTVYIYMHIIILIITSHRFKCKSCLIELRIIASVCVFVHSNVWDVIEKCAIHICMWWLQWATHTLHTWSGGIINCVTKLYTLHGQNKYNILA